MRDRLTVGRHALDVETCLLVSLKLGEAGWQAGLGPAAPHTKIFGDRLMVGRRALDAEIGVRIPVPELVERSFV